ncbi:MAG: DUF4065 domain-containing protein [Chloroflexi bacterium]|nr:DUF4065 domain-containing protein [Chloroflexota bacterium]
MTTTATAEINSTASFRRNEERLRAAWSPELTAYAERLGGEIEFARRLREFRDAFGLSVRAVGAITGEDPGDVSRLENRQLNPSVERADRILGRLRAYVEELGAEVAAAAATQEPVTTARDAAAYLCAIYDDRDVEFTLLKLQKLLYLAQGHALALLRRPLFGEKIKAWSYGPVIPQLRYEYEAAQVLPRPTDLNLLEVDPDVRAVLDRVYAEYGQLTAWALVDLTHAERPWRETPQNEEISLERMASFFSERLAAPTRAAGA